MTTDLSEIVGWWRLQKRSTADELKELIGNFQIFFAMNTNNIEGAKLNVNTTRAVFEGKNIKDYTGSFEDLFLVRNQQFCFNALMEDVVRKTPITTGLILKIHKVLMYGCYSEDRWVKGERPGSFKQHEYVVGTREVGTHPLFVREEIDDLLDELNSEAGGSVIMKAAYFHAVFETIHPFADGNGRVGRVLLNYYLMINDYPPVVIFDDAKETYYMALEVYNLTSELEGMKKLLEEQLIRTWGRFVNPDLEMINWCTANAPEALKSLSKTELLECMEPLYYKYKNM